MIWLIVLAVWLIANVVWNYRTYKEYGFIRVSDIFEALFVSPSMLILTFHNWMESKFKFWNYPLFMSKEIKSDIEFATKEMDEHIKNAAKELMEEIDKEIARKKIPTKKKDVIQENIDRMTPAEKKELKKIIKRKVGNIK